MREGSQMVGEMEGVHQLYRPGSFHRLGTGPTTSTCSYLTLTLLKMRLKASRLPSTMSWNESSRDETAR